jgi:hypothetical protein
MSETLIDFKDIDVPDDIPAPSHYEYECQVCGTELFYSGKGRKPKFCEEHKKSAPRQVRGSGNASLARQAAASLSQLNAMCGLMLFVPEIPKVGKNPLYLPQTGSAWANADEGFTEAAYNALLTDPKLCRMILKGGAAGGKLALLMAYGMLAAAITPVAMKELKTPHELRGV